MRVAEFLRNLIDCRDWFERDGKCILSENERDDIINLLAVTQGTDAKWVCVDVYVYVAAFLFFVFCTVLVFCTIS